jgi:hypothetical protein
MGTDPRAGSRDDADPPNAADPLTGMESPVGAAPPALPKDPRTPYEPVDECTPYRGVEV